MERTISAMVGKGSLNHNNRTFVAKNVDENRIQNNVCYVKKSLKKLYHDMFDEALEEYNAKQKRKDRKIDNYYEKIANSKQEKLFHELILQIGNKNDMSALNPQEVELSKAIFKEYMETFQERNPNLIIFNAVLHLDEATPHVHIDYVPVMRRSKRGLRVRTSMKGALAEQGFIGEGKGNTEWAKWAESEKKVLSDIMQKYDIGWKQLGTHKEHLDVLDYKKKVRADEVKKLDEQIAEREECLLEKVVSTAEKEQLLGLKEKRLKEIERQIAKGENWDNKISSELSSKKEELRMVSYELERIKEKYDVVVLETAEFVSLRNIAEKAMRDASIRVASFQQEISGLDEPKWSLPEPGTLTSAKTFFKEVALPLVQSLKDWIKTLTAQVKLLEGKVKELTDYKKWAEVKIKSQAKETVKQQEEFDTLMKDLEDYNLLKISFGPERMYSLLIEAMDLYEQKNGIPYCNSQLQEKSYKR